MEASVLVSVPVLSPQPKCSTQRVRTRRRTTAHSTEARPCISRVQLLHFISLDSPVCRPALSVCFREGALRRVDYTD
jgi:hypothetical protein